VIVCPNCGKENQDHYKFCLGCGAKLPAAGQAAPPPQPPSVIPAPVVPAPAQPSYPAPAQPSYPAPAQPSYPAPPPQYSAPPPPQPPPGYGPPPSYGTPPSYGAPPSPDFGTQATQAPPPRAQVPGAGPAMRKCPVCGTENPMQFKFCGACGGRMDETTTVGPAPTGPAPQAPPPAPPPAPQAAAPQAPAPQAAAPPEAAARTMFMDASQRPAVKPMTSLIRLVLLRDDGTEGGVLVIEGGPEPIGRMHGPPFDSDAYLDPNHAEFTATPEGLMIDDLGSLNGVYIKLDGRADLQDRDMFRVGQELMLYEDLPEPAPTDEGTEIMGSPNPGYWGRVSVMVSRDRAIAAFPLQNEGVTIGRESGEITFPDDGYVSGTHCRVVGDDTGVFIEDLGSSNGTYMRVRPHQVVPPGRLILVGQQLFRVEPG